jgi:hypothetical protein
MTFAGVAYNVPGNGGGERGTNKEDIVESVETLRCGVN